MCFIRRSVLILAIAGLPFFGIATAQTKTEEPSPATPLTTSPATDEILTDISLNDQSLEDALSLIETAHPQFKAVIFRDAMTSKDFPKLTMKLKGVSIGQFFNLVTTAFPTVEEKVINGPKGDVVCFMVHPDAKGQLPIAPMTRVYALNGVINAITDGQDPAKVKQTLDHVLSLIKAALDEVGGEPPTLRVHEQTQVLIFKGAEEQEAVISSVLKLLGPDEATLKRQEARADVGEAANLRRELEQTQIQLATAHSQIKELQEVIAKRDNESRQLASDSERLKVRLEMTDARAKDLEKQLAVTRAKAESEVNELRDAMRRAKDDAADLRHELSQRPVAPK